MNLEVIKGTTAEFESAISRPEADYADLSAYYTGHLSAAARAGADTIRFQSVIPKEKASDNFTCLGNIEGALLAFGEHSDLPKTVTIVCDTEETATLYRIVYNFWYATEPNAKMMQDGWD